MGDMAQDALHRAMLEEYMLEEYLSGNMSEEQAYENGFVNELGYSMVEDSVYHKILDKVWSKQLQEDDVINNLIEAGYGWKKYAESVSKQSRITDKQAETLYKMYEKLLRLRNAASARENWKPKDNTKKKQSYRDRHDGGLDWDEIGDWGGSQEW